jgi:hypothetical protein
MMRDTAVRRFRAVCPDGRVRTARPTAEADTVFSIPARVQVRGVTVSGFITGSDAVYNGSPEFASMLGKAEQAAFATGAPFIFYPARTGRNAEAAGGAWPS